MVPPLSPWALPLLAGPLLVGAAWDLARFRIPNLVPAVLVALFPAAAWLTGWSGFAWGDHLLGGALGLALGLLAFGLRAMGGGDAKLFAAAALWVGLERLVVLMITTSLAGGVLTIALLALRQRGFGAYLAAKGAAFPVLERKAPIPYGVAIAVGCLWLMKG